MQHLSTILVLIFIVLVNHNSHAETFSFSVEIGSSSSQVSKNNIVNKYSQLSTSSTLSTDTSTLFFSLNYELDKYLSIGSDLLISDSITASESGLNYKLFSTDTLSVYAKTKSLISPRVTIFGKLGMHLWSLSENLSSPGELDDGVDITYGIGTSIDLYGGSNRQLQIQLNHYDYNGVYVDSQDVITIGILFVFE